MSAKTMNDIKSPLARYLTRQMETNGIRNVDLARALGYERSNIISMFRYGETKIPIEQIPAIAKTLNVDSAHMVRLAFQEYFPGIAPVLDDVFGDKTFSKLERDVLDVVRGQSIDAQTHRVGLTDDQKTAIADAFPKD